MKSGSKWIIGIIIILVNAGLFTLISGKRSFIVDIIVYSVAVFFMRGKTIKLKGRTKLGIVIIIIAVGWAFNAISVGRGTTSFVQLFYV